MTQRTENREATPAEIAAADIVSKISALISDAYHKHRVRDQLGKEETFRAIMAGYFENKSMRDWCRDLGIDVPPQDEDAANCERIGEGR